MCVPFAPLSLLLVSICAWLLYYNQRERESARSHTQTHTLDCERGSSIERERERKKIYTERRERARQARAREREERERKKEKKKSTDAILDFSSTFFVRSPSFVSCVCVCSLVLRMRCTMRLMRYAERRRQTHHANIRLYPPLNACVLMVLCCAPRTSCRGGNSGIRGAIAIQSSYEFAI